MQNQIKPEIWHHIGLRNKHPYPAESVVYVVVLSGRSSQGVYSQ